MKHAPCAACEYTLGKLRCPAAGSHRRGHKQLCEEHAVRWWDRGRAQELGVEILDEMCTRFGDLRTDGQQRARGDPALVERSRRKPGESREAFVARHQAAMRALVGPEVQALRGDRERDADREWVLETYRSYRARFERDATLMVRADIARGGPESSPRAIRQVAHEDALVELAAAAVRRVESATRKAKKEGER